MSQAKLNGSADAFAERYKRLFELLAQMEIELLREVYEESGDEVLHVGFPAYVASHTLDDAWREQIVEKLEAAIDQLAKKPAPVIRHIWYSGQWHCLEVDGTRGDRALSEGIATHPAGYIAVTGYYGGASEALEGDNVPITDGGNVFSVIPAEHSTACTTNWDKDGEHAGESLQNSMERFAGDDKSYDACTPYAYASMPSYIAQQAKFAAEHPGWAERKRAQLDDLCVQGLVEWKTACVEKFSAMPLDGSTTLLFVEHMREAYGAGISAYVGKLHIGEYRCDTQRGIVFA